MRIAQRTRWAAVGAAAFLVACSPEPDPPTSNAAPDEPDPASQPAAEEPAIPAESSLTIKRGIASVHVDRMTFQPCGDTRAYTVIDQTDGTLAEQFADRLQSGPVQLYVEAYGERASEHNQPDLKSGAAFVLEEVLFAAPSEEVRGCPAQVPDFIVAARGNEPFWAAEVFDDRVLWKQPEEPTEIKFGAPQTEDAEGAVRYRADADGHQVELLIAVQPCKDSMSGHFFAFSAKVMLDGETLHGCARLGR